MDSKTEVMVALGVAMGVNCIPCFDHLYAKSKEVGLSDEDVQRISQIADKVKGGAAMFLKNAGTKTNENMCPQTYLIVAGILSNGIMAVRCIGFFPQRNSRHFECRCR